MRLFTPLRPDRRAPLARANPVAKLGAATLVMLAALASVDPVTPALLLVMLAAAAAVSGLAPRDLLARLWPLLAAALAIGLLNALFGIERADEAVVRIGPMEVSREDILAGAALALRVMAVALAGALAVATTDPTDMADALQQQLDAPARWVVAVLAAWRMLPLLAIEWQTLRLARRARGFQAGRSPVALVRISFGLLLSLLVAAVRRGVRLAMAMEARGFGARRCRTVARPQHMRGGDWALLGAAALGGTAAVGISVALGAWQFLIG
jgi:energy-coupling factor transport system permease protein